MPNFSVARHAVAGLALALVGGCGSDAVPKLNPTVVDVAPGTDIAVEATSVDTPAGTVICKADSDCASPTPACDPLAHACVACLSDDACTSGHHCWAKTCVPFVACKNSLDCKTAIGPTGADQPVCDKSLGECVECASGDDCPTGSECVGKRCVAYKDCVNSADCSIDQVCDPATKRCVECAAAEDCPNNYSCEGGTCKKFTACTSDKQCTLLNMLCDKSKGKCAQCLSNTDCPQVYHCVNSGPSGTGECALDVCQPGAGSCLDGKKVACTADGSGYSLRIPHSIANCVIS